MTLEIWRPTHHQDYEVSNLGRVRSYANRSGRGRRLLPKILKSNPDTRGYLSLRIAGRTRRVHTLVAAAFIGLCPKGQEVMHGDDDRANSQADNLSYGTRRQNLLDCYARGRR